MTERGEWYIMFHLIPVFDFDEGSLPEMKLSDVSKLASMLYLLLKLIEV